MTIEDFILVLLVGIISGYLMAWRILSWSIKNTIWARGFLMQMIFCHVGIVEIIEVRKILDRYPCTQELQNFNDNQQQNQKENDRERKDSDSDGDSRTKL
jgi:hypothetical protein